MTRFLSSGSHGVSIEGALHSGRCSTQHASLWVSAPRASQGYRPDGSAETWTAASCHFPSAFVKTKVNRLNSTRSGPSLGLRASDMCPQTMPVVPITRHCGLIGVNVTPSACAKFASASWRKVAFPSTGKGEKGGKATICSCQKEELALASRRLIARRPCAQRLRPVPQYLPYGCLLVVGFLASWSARGARRLSYTTMSVGEGSLQHQRVARLRHRCGTDKWLCRCTLPGRF
jgi:hypothetical protein